MLAKCDRTIWADTDAYCVKAFHSENGHFHGWESARHINNGVVGLPKDSETLAGLIDFTSDEYAIPDWFDEGLKTEMRAKKDAGDPVEQAKIYSDGGADEICFLDITASNENRDTIYDVVERTSKKC